MLITISRIHRDRSREGQRSRITYQSPPPRGSFLPLGRVSRDDWPAAADAKLEGKCEGIAGCLGYGTRAIAEVPKVVTVSSLRCKSVGYALLKTQKRGGLS